jgi:hypothetical protein
VCEGCELIQLAWFIALFCSEKNLSSLQIAI